MSDLATISDEWWHGMPTDAFVRLPNPNPPEFDFIGNERRTTAPYEVAGAGNPFYHLRGAGAEEDKETARKLAELFAPHIEKGIGKVADGIQDFLKSPEQREAEKRQKIEEERIQSEKEEREAGKWSSLLSPFFHLSGGAIDKYIAMAKEFAKRAGYKDWDSLRRADDGEHKLELRGVKFGRKGYGDFIKYSLDEGVDEARKHRDAYLSRATKIKGDWAKDMYSPNSLAINILWDGKSSCPMSGGMKSESELEGMSVVKLIDYGKSQGIKGLDGKTKKVIIDKILKQAPETEIVAPKDLTALQLYRMLLMEGSLKDDLIPLAKEHGVERILHKNKKQIVDELMVNLASNEDIQATDKLEDVPKVVMYLFKKGANPFPDEDEEDEESEPEVAVDDYEYDGVKYFVEEPREGLEFKDRRVFDPETYEELGTLGEEMWRGLAVEVADSEYDGMELTIGKPDAVIQPAPAPAPRTTAPPPPQYEGRTLDPNRHNITLADGRVLRPAWMGKGRAYTAEEWEQKLCKGENSLLAQKKRKIKERAEKGVPALETPMRTSRVIKATPPKHVDKGRQEIIDKIERQKQYVERLNSELRDEDRRMTGVERFSKARSRYRELASIKKLERKLSNYGKELTEDEKRLNEVMDEIDDIEAIIQSPIPSASFAHRQQIASENRQVKSIKDLRAERNRLQRQVKGSGKPVLAPQDVLEGKKDNPIVEEIIEEPMDDSDIRQYLPNAKVMRYSGLARLSDIEQLLPTDKSYVILLYENTPGSGHWVALMRYGNTIEFFCSYGSKIDEPLRWQNPKDNAMLGQRQPYLSILLNKAKGKFRAIHNPVAYQSKKQGVATCGAWDVMRINQMKNHNQDLQEFHNFMESVKKETGLTYDEIVVNYVSKR